MAQQHFYADPAAVGAVANRFDASAELIAAVTRSRLGFGGASAGRMHAARGDALRRALDGWAGQLAQWSRASAEIATALRVAARSYSEAELRATAGVG